MNSECSPLLAARVECTIFDVKIPSADSLGSKSIEQSNCGARLDTYCKKKTKQFYGGRDKKWNEEWTEVKEGEVLKQASLNLVEKFSFNHYFTHR